MAQWIGQTHQFDGISEPDQNKLAG